MALAVVPMGAMEAVALASSSSSSLLPSSSQLVLLQVLRIQTPEPERLEYLLLLLQPQLLLEPLPLVEALRSSPHEALALHPLAVE